MTILTVSWPVVVKLCANCRHELAVYHHIAGRGVVRQIVALGELCWLLCCVWVCTCMSMCVCLRRTAAALQHKLERRQWGRPMVNAGHNFMTSGLTVQQMLDFHANHQPQLLSNSFQLSLNIPSKTPCQTAVQPWQKNQHVKPYVDSASMLAHHGGIK